MIDCMLVDMNDWISKEIDRIFENIKNAPPKKIIFQTGYGPSGLPHTGTLCEIIRTKMLMDAFYDKYQIPTKLICFSDDMDGFRKVPENIPNQAMLHEYLGYRLSAVPDPFEKYASFAEYNNAMFRSFIDELGIDYEFKSATECYTSGIYNDALKIILSKETNITNIVKPHISPERAEYYTPIMPIINDIVIEDKITIIDTETIECRGNKVSILNGNCKLQWRADWALRHYVFGVHYEMHGKDLIESMDIAKKIVKTIGGIPPISMFYELFLDENGQKISKSKGNGVDLYDWFKYFPVDILKYFIYIKPTTAKRLSFEQTIEYADRYITAIEKSDPAILRIAENAHQPSYNTYGINYSLLVRLIYSAQITSIDMVKAFLNRYTPSIEYNQFLDELILKAYNYTRDIYNVEPMNYQLNDNEISACYALTYKLKHIDDNADINHIQSAVYEIAREHYIGEIREFFACIYKYLMDSHNGPRLGTYIKIYGVQKFRNLLLSRIDNDCNAA